jgi:hypothetical protein
MRRDDVGFFVRVVSCANTREAPIANSAVAPARDFA